MMADSGGRTVSWRPRRRGTFRHASRRRSFGAALVGAALASTALAACGSSGGGTGPVTLNFYSFNDPSGAVATAVTNCTKASGGKYTISYNKLPAAADDQRLQMAGRLDPALDRHVQAAGGGGDPEGPAGNRDLEGQARRGALQQQHPAAVVPVRPGAKPPQDLGRNDQRRGAAREAGQAAPDRDPGRAVRGRDGLVQHPGRQRGREHPHAV